MICVSEYLIKNNIKPDCVVVFTDGFLENDIQWDIDTPTLWLVCGNERFIPPKGQKVRVEA